MRVALRMEPCQRRGKAVRPGDQGLPAKLFGLPFGETGRLVHDEAVKRTLGFRAGEQDAHRIVHEIRGINGQEMRMRQASQRADLFEYLSRRKEVRSATDLDLST